MFHPQRLAETPIEVDQVLALLKLDPGARILDLPCGIGRHSLEFSRRGYRVTGVDRTRNYLRQAQRQAKKEGLDVEWIQQDMRRFARLRAFDAAINLFTSFGYFDDQADDRKVLANFFRSLKPGGKLLMDLMGKEVLAKKFQPRSWSEEDGTIILEERLLTRHWSWIESRWTLIKGRSMRAFRVAHRLYSAEELASLLQAVGFRKVSIYGNLVGGHYDHLATRLVALALKP